jgi:hypothetical protein
MTQGETLFYLREIHSHWSTSNVSRDKLAELEATKLIEINNDPIIAVRLTSEGARIKSAGRPAARNGLIRSPHQRRRGFQRNGGRKQAVSRPKPLV